MTSVSKGSVTSLVGKLDAKATTNHRRSSVGTTNNDDHKNVAQLDVNATTNHRRSSVGTTTNDDHKNISRSSLRSQSTANEDCNGTSTGSSHIRRPIMTMSPTASVDLRNKASKVSSSENKKMSPPGASAATESTTSATPPSATPPSINGNKLNRIPSKKDPRKLLPAPNLGEIGKLDTFLKNPKKSAMSPTAMSPNLHRSIGKLNYDNNDADDTTFVCDDDSSWWENNSINSSANRSNAQAEKIFKKRPSKMKLPLLNAVSENETNECGTVAEIKSIGNNVQKENQNQGKVEEQLSSEDEKSEEVPVENVKDEEKKVKKLKKEKKASTSKGTTQRISIKVTGGDLDLSSLEASGNIEQAEKLKEAFEKWKQTQASKKDGSLDDDTKSKQRSSSRGRRASGASRSRDSEDEDDVGHKREQETVSNDEDDKRSRQRSRSIGVRSTDKDANTSSRGQRSRGRSTGPKRDGSDEITDGKSCEDKKKQQSRGRSIGHRSKEENSDESNKKKSKEPNSDVKQPSRRSKSVSTGLRSSNGNTADKPERSAPASATPKQDRSTNISRNTNSSSDPSSTTTTRRRCQSVGRPIKRSDDDNVKERTTKDEVPTISRPTRVDLSKTNGNNSKKSNQRSRSLARNIDTQPSSADGSIENEAESTKPSSSSIGRRSRSTVRRRDSNESENIRSQSTHRRRGSNDGGEKSTSDGHRSRSVNRRRQSNEYDPTSTTRSADDNRDEISSPVQKTTDNVVDDDNKMKSRSKSVGRGRQSMDGKKTRAKSVGRVRKSDEDGDDRVKELSKAIPWESFLEAETTR